MHSLRVSSFFFTKRTGAPHGDVLMHPRMATMIMRRPRQLIKTQNPRIKILTSHFCLGHHGPWSITTGRPWCKLPSHECLTQNWVNFAGSSLELQISDENDFGTHLKIEKSAFQWDKNQVNRSSFARSNLAPKLSYLEPGEIGCMELSFRVWADLILFPI